MKQCGACKTTYTDDTLRYCLADGTILTDFSVEQPTLVRHGETFSAEKTVAIDRQAQMRVEIPQTPPRATFQPAVSAPERSSGGIFKVILVVIGLGIFAVIAVAAGAFVYFNAGRTDPAANLNNNEAKILGSPSPTPAKNETDELRDQIANLEKLINEQKKNNQPANVPLSMPKQSTTTTTARVNSPGDGFLALRTLPNSEAGERILKIPHGAAVSIGACGPVVRPVSRTGRWCQASYNGYSGWVFDAYLIY